MFKQSASETVRPRPPPIFAMGRWNERHYKSKNNKSTRKSSWFHHSSDSFYPTSDEISSTEIEIDVDQAFQKGQCLEARSSSFNVPLTMEPRMQQKLIDQRTSQSSSPKSYDDNVAHSTTETTYEGDSTSYSDDLELPEDFSPFSQRASPASAFEPVLSSTPSRQMTRHVPPLLEPTFLDVNVPAEPFFQGSNHTRYFSNTVHQDYYPNEERLLTNSSHRHSNAYQQRSSSSLQTSSHRAYSSYPQPSHLSHSNHNRNNHYTWNQPRKVIRMEVSPGQFLELRSSDETIRAVEQGYAAQVSCLMCPTFLATVPDCLCVICPECRFLSPVEEEEDCGLWERESHRRRHGVGLGLKL
jgi:hypothetical protein